MRSGSGLAACSGLAAALWIAAAVAQEPAAGGGTVRTVDAVVERQAGQAGIRVLTEGERAFVGLLRLAPKATVPMHRDASEEHIVVLSGSGVMTLDGRRVEVGPGTAVLMRADAEVGFENGPEPLLAVQVFAGPESAAKYESWKPVEPPAAPVALPSLDGGARVVDLTWPFDEHTLYWPTSPSAFELRQLHHGPTAGGWFYASNTICTPEHGGTHLDAPIHFGKGKQTTDEIPLDRLIGEAVVIDVSSQAAKDPDYRLTPADVVAFEAAHGRVPKDAIVLLRTGWGARWPNRKTYFGDDTPGDASRLHFPSFGAEATRLLIDERNVAVLGVDTASIDHGPSKDFPVHRLAAEAQVPGLENVAHLEQLPPRGATVIALPMKIAGGSGGPVRIVALLPR
jgi:kynurenine formamidase/quercetin dioxygenase-like cupin family protein